MLLQITAAAFVVLVVLVVAHSLPITAVAVLGVQHWQEIRGGSMTHALVASVNRDRVLLLTSFVVLAGAPVLEELLRTLRKRPERT